MKIKYIIEAKKFLEEAREEFKRGVGAQNEVIMRDACEKGWGAVIQAINALFEKQNIKELPKTHRERRIALAELERRHSLIAVKKFRDRFMARSNILHSAAFYNGYLDPTEIGIEFDKVEELIKDIEEL